MKTMNKVFLCLRTNMFKDLEGEHITLRYYNEVSWKDLIKDAERFNKHVPDTVMVKDYGTWNTWSEEFVGARLQQIAVFDEAELKMPHITLSRKPSNYGWDDFMPLYSPQDKAYEVVDTIYLGKKINGKLEFMPVSTSDILPTAGDYLYT